MEAPGLESEESLTAGGDPGLKWLSLVGPHLLWTPSMCLCPPPDSEYSLPCPCPAAPRKAACSRGALDTETPGAADWRLKGGAERGAPRSPEGRWGRSGVGIRLSPPLSRRAHSLRTSPKWGTARRGGGVPGSAGQKTSPPPRRPPPPPPRLLAPGFLLPAGNKVKPCGGWSL